jgi:hypothetical protein
MKKLFLMFTLLCLQAVYAQPNTNIDYKKIFVKNSVWETDPTFLKWATPLNSQNTSIDCSLAIKKLIRSNPNKVLSCKQVSTIKGDKTTEPAVIVWANFKTVKPSEYGHDCNAGLIYLSKTKKIVEDSPASCEYVEAIEEPFSDPILIYKVRTNGAIGIIAYGQGAECGGTSAIEQAGNQFHEVHVFEWSCMQ